MRKIGRILILFGVIVSSLNSFSQTDNRTIIELVRKNSKQLRISAADTDNLGISSSHTDERTGITYVYIQQQYKGIKVHNSIISAAFKEGSLLHFSGAFVSDMATKAGQSNPAVSAADAVLRAATELKLSPAGLQILADKFAAEKKITFSPAGIAKRDIEAELFWVTAEEGKTIKLAWHINIDVLHSSDWWNVFIDAVSGRYISQYNWTVHDNFGAPWDKNGRSKKNFFAANHAFNTTGSIAQNRLVDNRNSFPPNVTSGIYNVVPFPNESPLVSGTAQVNNPWEMAGANNNATTHGWHFDGTTNYDITRGNNVFAYLDVTGNNTVNSTTNWPDTSATSAPSLTFLNTLDVNASARSRVNKKFGVDNLFYWNNLMHDVYYQYGFTEAAGNFQTDNLGRGGAGNDWVNAEAQDGSGTDNANFASGSDGISGRMQMFLWQSFSLVNVTAPAGIAGTYLGLESAFSTANKLRNVGPVTGQVVYYNDNPGGTVHEACGVGGSPFNSISGKIALIDRGTCNFTEKVKNAQNAGAIAVIMVNNVPGDPGVMGGTDNTITIPAVMISQADGAIIAAQLAAGVTVTLSDGDRDGDLDNGIVCHEYGHGISGRLTGGAANPSCLINAEQGGEGWSDYFGLMMTTNWATANINDGALAHPLGNYASSQPLNGQGIRFYPYSTNMTIDPLTYANMGVAPIGGESHNIGEIWCAALWDMTWNIIQQQNSITPSLYNSGGTGGNAIALNLVVTGLKLQPCQPGFLDARNAILAADSLLYNYAHKCAIWNAFARRGMGVSAIQGSSNNTSDQTAAFDVPAGINLNRADPVIVNSGETFSLSTTANCNCQPLTGYTIKNTIPAGFTVVSATPSGTLNGNIYSFPASDFAANESKTFSLTLQATMAGCTIDSVINDDRDGSTTGNFTSSTTGTGGGWNSSSAKSHSGTSSWKAAEPSTISTASLASASLAAAAGKNLSVLSFWHLYNTEESYDGGVVEYSTNGGTSWNDASSLFIKNGYNELMDVSTVLAGRKAFTGSNLLFTQSLINLSSFGTTPLIVRFQMTSDEGTPGEGWYVDDIVRANGCGGIFKTGVYSGLGNTPVDEIMIPVFVKTVPNTITVNTQPANTTVCAGQNAGFTIAATSATTLSYQWQVSTDGGNSFSDIPGETGSSLSLSAVTVTMNGYKYRCVLADASSTLNSNAATLTVNPVAVISTEPANQSVCVNSNASFTVTAAGALSYQWQVSTDGGSSFTNISGATSAALSLTGVTAAMNNNQYRCIASNVCSSDTSIAVALTVANAGITTQPASQAKCAGDNADFIIVTTGTVTYQWQVSTNGGGSFTNISAATSATLSLTSVTAAMNNNQYRCIVTVSCGVLTSSVATLTVNSLPAVSAQPADKIVCVNTNTSFAVTATGVISYQWELSTDGGATFTAISGAASAAYNFTAGLSQNNNKYRCVITNSCGSVISSVATLTVTDAGIVAQPVNSTKCPAENAAFSITTTGAGLGYQWQVSTNGGSSFANIPGATDITLSLAAVTPAMNNNQYRCIVTASCGVLTSSAAVLTVSFTDIAVTALPSKICLTDGLVSLNATPAGGVWSGTAVSGNSFNPATAGLGVYMLTYTYTSAGNCIDVANTTATVEDCIDRNLALNNGGIILFPNPNNGEFKLQSKSLLFDHLGVRVYNSLGQLVDQRQFTNVQYDQVLTINLKRFAAGVYSVKVFTDYPGNSMETKTFTVLIAR